ncbi:methylenetetrahydrofolate reductase [Pseudonocardia abyssalis]|uniref:Methylenetetrahydrofolate reductase n=1 Tax=Pseudonocardia abyssalis TaxID=2792008 RepID=A0ABS6UNE2_9PSEU|nr:methylenetetrahydrofolate reductase [Pseudonocardia abyssalis]MBW0115108.1 methylenetetrahydrofolate reductase [Pseudonocardia abyssalis]MBW0133752.1 methylenetetrahydrofolate reductase [Pseudonocardia abyssalis]
MRPATTGAEPLPVRAALATALREASYEVLPLRGAEEKVLAHVPTEVPVSVTTTETRGLDSTLDLAVRLTAAGYRAAPHLAARLIRDAKHLHDVQSRLREAGVDGVFVIGGDAPAPAGPFPDALSLLEALDRDGDRFASVGIGGYPEGHGRIGDALIERALVAKAPHATHVVTQLCFDAGATVRWAQRIREDGVGLPVRVGVPGPVARTKLVRIAAGLGLGQSARFLAKQQNLIGRFLLPGGYRPDRLVRRLAPTLARPDRPLAGLHVYTFNELAATESWRQGWLARLAEEDR